MPRVFIVEHPRRHMDISSAEVFGDIQYLFGEADRRASVLNSEMYIADVITQLRTHKFDPEVDYFAVAGGIVNVSQAMIAVTLYTGRTCLKLLLFNSSVGIYEERVINLSAFARITGEQNASIDRSSGSGS